MRTLVACVLLIPAVALAQSWPQKPIRVVVPFPPGGVTDSLARITAEWLTQRLGQPVVPDNRPGASGAIAADLVARADPDGYTLLSAATPQLAIVPHVQKISYDPVKDFAPISIVGTNAFALGCNDKTPAKTLAEFVEYVKARPGQLNYGSPGSGSVGHLTMALFLTRAGLKMEAVLYKGGGPAMADVIAGHVNCYFGNYNEILPHVGSGRVRVLATSGARRAHQLPDVPTVAEQGYPGFRTETWNGYVAPAGTPREIVAKLNADINKAMQVPEVRARLEAVGTQLREQSAAEFETFMKAEVVKYSKLIKDANIRIE